MQLTPCFMERKVLMGEKSSPSPSVDSVSCFLVFCFFDGGEAEDCEREEEEIAGFG